MRNPYVATFRLRYDYRLQFISYNSLKSSYLLDGETIDG